MLKAAIDQYPVRSLFILSLLIFLFLVLRNTGLYPAVFTDEYIYSKFARLTPLSESEIPSYLYLSLFSLTNYCGDGFLGCAKILNAIVFVSAAPFIFLVARSISGNGTSLAVTLLALIGPINGYTAYFMPESLYFFGFWAFAWYLLQLNSQSDQRRWLTAGAIFALTALIKPHSVFFLPAITTYIFYLSFKQQNLFSITPLKNTATFLACALLVKFTLGYVLAGPAGITIFGPLYGSIAESSSTNPHRYLELLTLALQSIKGHFLAISILFALPLTIASAVFLKQFASETSATAIDKIGVFSLLVLFNLIIVVALFTASIANSDPVESTARLHMRYYNFALPLLPILAGGLLANKDYPVSKSIRYLLGCVVGATALYALYTNMVPYIASHVDNPELRGLHYNTFLFRLTSGLSIAALMIWILLGRSGIKLYMYVAMPLAVVVSAFNITQEQRQRLTADTYDKAGRFAADYLLKEELGKVVVAGTAPAGLFRTLFYLDHSNATIKVLSEGAPYNLNELPSGKEWLLLIGNHKPSRKAAFELEMNGFRLVKARHTGAIDFRKSSWPGFVLRASGLSSPESWGTWSVMKEIRIELTSPPPARFKLVLSASAFGPNIGKAVHVSIGNSSSEVILSDQASTQTLALSNREQSNILTITVPKPTSPLELGISHDERQLGIALTELRIESAEPDHQLLE